MQSITPNPIFIYVTTPNVIGILSYLVKLLIREIISF